MVRTATITFALCALLAACNTTDALTPRVGIGEDGQNLASSPVTQNDTERMAAAPRQPVFSSETRDTYHSAYDQRAYQGQGYGPDGASSTLDGQADAIRTSGVNPQASKPLDDERRQDDAMQAQAPDDSEQQEADRRLGEQPRQQEQTQQPEQEQPPQQEQQQASLPQPGAGDDTIRFLPIIGAPVQSVTPLSRQLGAEARSRGLTIKSSNDTTSSYILKGYLSAFQDGPAITVTYVWDVLDNSGARLHRIQGNESVPLKAGDPWNAVPASVMQQIGSKTMAEFTSWRQTRGG
jgi:predicted small secreted protein